MRAARDDDAAEASYADAGTTIDVGDRRLRNPNRSPTRTTTGTDRAGAEDQAEGGTAVAALALLASALLAGRRR